MKIDPSALMAAMRQTVAAVADSVDESALRKAGVAGAAVFRDEAKRNAQARMKTGALFRNIIIKHQPEHSDGAKRQSYVVTVRSGKFGADGDPYYWKWVEGGHKIVWRRKGQKLKDARKEAAKAEFGTSRVPPAPFMRPAYESKKQEAMAASMAELATTGKREGG